MAGRQGGSRVFFDVVGQMQAAKLISDAKQLFLTLSRVSKVLLTVYLHRLELLSTLFVNQLWLLVKRQFISTSSSTMKELLHTKTELLILV